MKKRNPYLGTVLAIGIVLVIMFTGLNKSFDPIREYIPVLWILSIIWKIYLSLKHHSMS